MKPRIQKYHIGIVSGFQNTFSFDLESPGRIQGQSEDCIFETPAGPFDEIAERRFLGQRAAGKTSFRVAAYASGYRNEIAAQTVLPVGHVGGADRIGSKDHASLSFCPGKRPNNRSIDVDTVGNDFREYAIVGKYGARDSGIAVRHRPHGIE